MLTTDTQTYTLRWGILEYILEIVINCAQLISPSHFEMVCLYVQSTELGGRLSGLLERYQQYQDEVVSLHSWLSTQEQNQSIAKPSGETDPQNLQNTLRQVQVKHTLQTFTQSEKADFQSMETFCSWSQPVKGHLSQPLHHVEHSPKS